jgi:hypothetical protein
MVKVRGFSHASPPAAATARSRIARALSFSGAACAGAGACLRHASRAERRAIGVVADLAGRSALTGASG